MRRSLLPVLLLLVALVVAGCGQDGSTSDAAAPTGQGAAFPVTLASPGGKVVLDQRPERIVSLSPTATEMLFAIGAGGQVVAVDSNSNYPAEAPKTDLSAYQPNIEAIAGYKPDLVVYSDDPGELAAGLGKLSIPALQQPAATRLDDTYAQLDQLGRATGHAGRGRPAHRDHARRDREDRRRRPARAAADLLPRAGQEPVLGDLQDLHRPALRPARPEEHRRRGRQGRPAATRSCRPSTWSRPTPT